MISLSICAGGRGPCAARLASSAGSLFSMLHLSISFREPPGPLVRLTGVREWSVEYDELNVTIWVSTDVADYKLFT